MIRQWHALAAIVSFATLALTSAEMASRAAAEPLEQSVAKGAAALANGASSLAREAVEAVTPGQPKQHKKKKLAKKAAPEITDPKKATAGDSKTGPEPAAKPSAADVHAADPAHDTLDAAETPNAATAPKSSFPVTLPEAKAQADAKTKPPETWTPAEIADGKARCAVILKRINAVAIQEAPIREGACGAPAPIQLISIGTKPEVSISPPAIITCDLAEGLATWLANDLQPLAKKHLGAEIIKIENMSSYSCRNAYGRAKNKLSEHGVANALDIRGFVTASAKTAFVLEDWGTPQREILARLAAEKAAAEKLAADKAAAEKAAQTAQLANKNGAAPGTPPSATASTLGAPAAGIARSTIVDGIPKITLTVPGGKPLDGQSGAFSITEPDRLGGPKRVPAEKSMIARVAVKAAAPPADSDRGAISGNAKTEFLHAAHAAACRIFGTTLGPEANEAHRNHFHVDMAERKTAKICD